MLVERGASAVLVNIIWTWMDMLGRCIEAVSRSLGYKACF